jgi:hypothetical protein
MFQGFDPPPLLSQIWPLVITDTVTDQRQHAWLGKQSMFGPPPAHAAAQGFPSRSRREAPTRLIGPLQALRATGAAPRNPVPVRCAPAPWGPPYEHPRARGRQPTPPARSCAARGEAAGDGAPPPAARAREVARGSVRRRRQGPARVPACGWGPLLETAGGRRPCMQPLAGEASAHLNKFWGARRDAVAGRRLRPSHAMWGRRAAPCMGTAGQGQRSRAARRALKFCAPEGARSRRRRAWR